MGTYKSSHSNKRKDINYVGVTISAIFAVVFLLACFPFLGVVNKFVVGVFGLAIYPYTILGMLVGYAIATGKRFSMPTRNLVLILISSALLIALLHTIFSGAIIRSYADVISFKYYGKYLSDLAGINKGVSVGGVVFGIFVYPLAVLFGSVGASIIFAIALCVSVGFLVDYYVTAHSMKVSRKDSPAYFTRSIPDNSKSNERIDDDTIESAIGGYSNSNKVIPYKSDDDEYSKFLNYRQNKEVSSQNQKSYTDSDRQNYEIKDSIVKTDRSEQERIDAMGRLYGNNASSQESSQNEELLDKGYDKSNIDSLKDYIMKPYVPPIFTKNNSESDNKRVSRDSSNIERSETHIDMNEITHQNPTDAFERFRSNMNRNGDIVGDREDRVSIDSEERPILRDDRDLPHTNPMAIDDFDNPTSFNRDSVRANERESRSESSLDGFREYRRSSEVNRDNIFDRDNSNRNIDINRDDRLNREDRSNDITSPREEARRALFGPNAFGADSFSRDTSLNRNSAREEQSDFRTNRNDVRSLRDSDRQHERKNTNISEREIPRSYFVEPKKEKDNRFPSLDDFDSDESGNIPSVNRGQNNNNSVRYDNPEYLDSVTDERYMGFEPDNFGREKSGRGKDLRPRKTPERGPRDNSFNRETFTVSSPFSANSLNSSFGINQNSEASTNFTASQTKSPFSNMGSVDKKYNAPPTDILVNNSTDPSEYGGNYESKVTALEAVLESFKIPAKVVNVIKGPTFSKFELAMPQGIPVKKVLSYDGDIAMALMSKSGVRIEAPIPGKNAVGIEIPNDKRATVGLREILESKEFKDNKSILPVAIGKNIYGETVVTSMAKMVHLLVAGSTGSGKSVFLHNLILSLMYKSSPSQLRFIMIDPKRVEFGMYNGMPHLMLPNVVTDCEKAINAFTWAVKEMDRRYKLFETHQLEGVNDIEKYNKCEAVINGSEPKIPYIVVIVDELADLMMVGKRDVEGKIQRIAQLGRACGIHLVIATQRPSVEVVTGTIKSNLPTRVAFSLTSAIDSRTILDEGGAEKLLGKGDMLYSPQDASVATRLQAAYTETSDIKKVINYIKENNEIYFDEEVEKEILADKQEEVKADDSGKDNSDGPDYDELLPQALKYFIETNSGSTSMIQRRFRVGYARAARILDQMEVAGFVSPANGSKARSIYITMEQYENMFGDNADGDGTGDVDSYYDDGDGGYDE